MSFDGLFTHFLTKELNQQLSQGRINKIYQLSTFDLLFQIRAKGKNNQLIISSSPMYTRIHLSTQVFEKPKYPPTFCMFLRKHLEGGIILAIDQIENDRVIKMTIKKTTEIGDKVNKYLFIELIGKQANIIITDHSNTILECINHIPPFETHNRTLYPGAKYKLPVNSKRNPFQDDYRSLFNGNIEYTDTFFIQHFQGISPLFSKEIMYQSHLNTMPMYTLFTSLIHQEIKPTITYGKKESFYCFDLTHLTGEKTYFPTINDMLDRYYHERDTYDRIRQKSKDLDKFIKKQYEKNQYKLEKLNKDLKKSKNNEIYKIKGELILANTYNITKGDSLLECINYYDNQEISITLNPLLSPNENSQSYFKKYKKAKTAIFHLEKQIELTKKEIAYFELLQLQMSTATLKDVLEIREELERNRYLKQKQTQKKKKNTKPNFDTYVDELGIEILVGKNNIQNEYLTHKLAKKDETWMHVKDAPGSHIIIRSTDPLEEATIRTAAQLAAYYSKQKDSSSVPVDYTKIKHIKKIPGYQNSFVSYTNNKTIYIDPDTEFIYQLQKK